MRSYELATNSQNSYELPWECVVVGIVGLMFAVLISIGNNYFKTSRGGKSLSFEFWLILTPNKSIFNLGRDSAARLDTHLIWMWATAVLCILCIDPRLWCDATSCCSSTDWIYFFCFTEQVLLMLPTHWCRPSVLCETWSKQRRCHRWRGVGKWTLMEHNTWSIHFHSLMVLYHYVTSLPPIWHLIQNWRSVGNFNWVL